MTILQTVFAQRCDCRVRRSWLFVLLFGLLSCVPCLVQDSAGQERSRRVIHFEIRGGIGPASSDFLVRALKHAQASNAMLVVLELDTPGGLDSATREMVQAILAAPVPVAIYVSPSGARAASAGTYLMYASHIAAMAPATSLGAATPIQIGGGPPTQQENPGEAGKAEKGGEESAAPATALERKAVNDAVAFIRGLAELRGRNADWAEAAVREAVSLTSSDALKQNVVDFIAADLPDLLRQLDGLSVKTRFGTVQLATEGVTVEEFTADWRTKLLSVLTNPNVAYFLLLAGVYGLLLEGYNPGAIVPGVVGAVSLVLALYAFQILSVNYAGLALMALGVVLIVGEAFAPSFGALGIGGIVAFVAGSVLLFDGGAPGFQIARGVIGGTALAAGIVMLLTVGVFMKARRARVVAGVEQLLQEKATALEDFSTTGFVDIHGERWRAQTKTPVVKGQQLRVLSVDGLTLTVSPLE